MTTDRLMTDEEFAQLDPEHQATLNEIIPHWREMSAEAARRSVQEWLDSRLDEALSARETLKALDA
jgi:hypothetical protein